MNKVGGVLEEYVAKLRQFVDGDITACQFEESYLKIFKNEEKVLPEHVFEVLNELFTDVDSFCSDPELRDDEDLDDTELLYRAELALKKLVS